MKENKLPVGAIGLGRLGYLHAANLATKINSINLVAVAEQYDTVREKFSSEFDVKAYKDYHDLISNPEIKAVVITTPTSTHVEIAKEAINAGKYVFTEKPTSDTLAGAKELYEFVEKKDAFLQVGFMMRFYPGHVGAKQNILNGKIGKPAYFQSCGRDSGVPKLEFVKKSGGLIYDMMIHDLDLARWYLQSDPIKVYAQGGVLMHDCLKGIDLDEAIVIVDFEDDKMATLEVSRNCKYGYDARHEIIGDKGAVMVGPLRDRPYSLFTTFSNEEKQFEYGKEGELCDSKKIEEFSPNPMLRYQNSYIAEFEYFAEHIRKEIKPELTAYDGFMAIKICEAAYRSIKEEKPIYLK